jgi:hypothetical protein
MNFVASLETPRQSEAATARRAPVATALCRRILNCNQRNFFGEAPKTAREARALPR